MSEKHDRLRTIKLVPDNHRRLRLLVQKAPVFTVNKLANTVLALSLHTYERNVNRLLRGKP